MLKQLAGFILGITITAGMLEGSQSSNSLKSQYHSLNRIDFQKLQARVKNPVSLNELESAVHEEINNYRRSKGLRPLRLDSRISRQARIHSEDMARGEVPFSHDGFKTRIKIINRQISYRRAAENVAFNQGFADPADRAVLGWLKSSGHRRNIEGNFDLTGIGVSKGRGGAYYFTQIFILEEED